MTSQSFSYTPANTTVETKGSKSVLVKATGYEKLRISVMLWLMEGNSPFVVLNGKNLPKQKLPDGIIGTCNEKGWAMEEKSNAGFRCFQGQFNRESENCNF
jgi:hypothetical protein